MKNQTCTVVDAQRNYDLGCIAGWEEVLLIIQTKAADSFVTGQDQAAHLYRNLAQEVEKQRKIKRAQYDDQYKRE